MAIPTLQMAIGKQRVGESPRFASEADYIASVQRQTRQMVQLLTGVMKAFGDVSEDIMLEVLQPTFEKTQVQVPVDTGDLKASGYLEKASYRGKPRVEMGYGYRNSPFYAQLVHENVAQHHRPPTKAKFLQDPVMEDLDEIYARLGAAYKRFMGA